MSGAYVHPGSALRRYEVLCAYAERGEVLSSRVWYAMRHRLWRCADLVVGERRRMLLDRAEDAIYRARRTERDERASDADRALALDA